MVKDSLPDANSRSNANPNSFTKRTGYILVVEDSPTQAVKLTMILEVQGYEVEVCENVPTAIESITERLPDLIISDVVMPGMSGYDLCKTLKKDHKLDIPVILVTTLKSPVDVLKGLDSGADNFLTKPYNEEYLLGQINYLLTNRQLRQHRRLEMGIELELNGERHLITAERQQILDLLISTYGEAVHLNDELAKREQNLRNSVRALDTLFKVSDALQNCKSYQEIFDVAITHLCALPNIEHGWVYHREDVDKPWTLMAKSSSLSLDVDPNADVVCECITDAEDGNLSDVRTYAECRLCNPVNDSGHLSIPVHVENTCLAVINVQEAPKKVQNIEQNNIISTIANQLSVALQRTDFLLSLERRVEQRTQLLKEKEARQRCLANFSRMMQGSLSQTELGEQIAQIIVECFPKLGGIVLFANAFATWDGVEKVQIDPQSVSDDDQTNEFLWRKLKKTSGLCSRVIQNWTDVSLQSTAENIPSTNVATSLTCQIAAENEIFGAIILHSHQEHVWSDSDIGFIETLASSAARFIAQMNAHKALESSEHKFRRIVESNLFGVFFLNKAGKVTYANSTFLKVVDIEDDAAVPFDLQEIVSEQTIAEIDQRLAARSEGKGADQNLPSELMFKCHNGREVPLLVNFAPLLGSDNYVAIALDISDLKAAQQQVSHMQKMETIATLTGGVAHDFNNLLAVIIGNTEVLSDESASANDVIEASGVILKAAEAGSQLTRQLLAFAREQSLEPSPVDLNATFDGLRNFVGRLIGAEISVALGTAQDIWTVFCDKGQLENAILNLVINARDVVDDKGQIKVHAENTVVENEHEVLGEKVEDGDYVKIVVSDNGSGIDPKVLPRILEPFYTTKQVGKGSGLGLAMVYGFVNQSGGFMRITTKLGEGSDFALYFPRHEQAVSSVDDNSRDTANEIDATITAENYTSSGINILVVEDNEAVAAVVLKQLKILGFRYEHVVDSASALERIEQNPDNIDLVFSDVKMPGGISGIKLANIISEKWPSLKVILTSGSLEEVDKENLRIPVLEKPYRKQQLLEKLLEALGKDGAN